MTFNERIADALGGIITMTLFALLMWAYLVLTPDQLSGEADFTAEAAEGGAK
jgi:hypothetical protein